MTIILWLLGLGVGGLALAIIYDEVFSALERNPNIGFPYGSVERKRSMTESAARFCAEIDKWPDIQRQPGGHFVYGPNGGIGIWRNPGGVEEGIARGDIVWDEQWQHYRTTY